MTDSILTTAIDSFVSQAHTSSNYGGSPTLTLETVGGGSRRALVWFGKPYPAGAVISAATLKLRLAGAWTGQTLTARRITEAWAEGKVTWANQPATTDDDLATVVATGVAGDAVEIDVTAMIAAVAAGAPFFGFRVDSDGATGRLLYSAEAHLAERHPELDITWSLPPVVPTHLHPGDTAVIGIASPYLSWQPPGDQTSAQLQICSALDFVALELDTGKIALVTAGLDTAATAFAAAEGETWYWRVKVWGATDLPSDWSDPASFTRTAKPGVVLDNPPGSGEVTETTPPIAWTADAQASWEALLWEIGVGGGLTQRADSGEVAGADTAWNVPAGILQEGRSYRAEIRIWDGLNRQDTATEAGYAGATQDFVYVVAGTPDPVETLEATADGPRVVLAFTRTEEPDYFALRVNGTYVADMTRLDPTELRTDGDAYAIEYWRATPRQAQTFEVEAVVDDAGVLEHSAGNPTAEATTDPRGWWLVDETDGLSVNIAGAETPATAMGETSTVFYPLEGPPVLITSGIRGLEGSVSGLLVDTYGTAAATWRDNLQALRRRRAPALRLIASDVNIPVRIWAVIPGPTPIPAEQEFVAGFEFFQSGELPEPEA